MGLQELALLLLFILPLCSAQNTYYVLPTPDTPACPILEPKGYCCVLSDCVERLDQYFTSNTMLVFLPGSHMLDRWVQVEGVNNLTLTGESSTVNSTITCNGTEARFVFNETLGLNISALAFESCASGGLPGVSLMSVSDSQITNCRFQNRMFQNCSSDDTSGIGSALMVQFGGGNIVISDCVFENNTAVIGGGAFISDNNNSVSFIRNQFINNTANFGGGLAVNTSTVTLMENSFVNNTASQCSETVVRISISGETDIINNTAGRGGGLFVQSSDIFFSGNTSFEMNTAQRLGGSMLLIIDCIFANNSAVIGGGAFILENNNSVSLIRNQFISNTANFGGGLAVQLSTVTLMENSFVSNTASQYSETVVSSQRFGGSMLLISNSTVTIAGDVRFESSSADYGAAVAVIQSNLITKRTTCFQSNEAVYGAGIYSREANVTLDGDVTFYDNRASFGGALYASSSNLKFEGFSNVTHNSATNGGGLLLTDGSTMYLFPSTELYFIDNSASETGGAITVEDSTPLAYCTEASRLTAVVSSDCFFQLQNQTVLSPSDVSAVITFENNTAALGGSDLYGGIIDNCRLQNTELHSGNVFNHVTRSEAQVSSDPLNFCLCRNDTPRCDESYSAVFNSYDSYDSYGSYDAYIYYEAQYYDVIVYPGQTFQISVITNGQRDGQTAGIVRAEAFNNLIQFQDIEYIQRTNIINPCTTLHYTLLINSSNMGERREERIILFAEGPCQRFLEVSVAIYPCPAGFQQSELTCVCDNRLNEFTNVTCNISDRTILRPRGAEFWVGYNYYPNGLILHPQCPFDYCRSDESFISVGDGHISGNEQCNYNRARVLCGECSYDHDDYYYYNYNRLSLVLGSSRCMRCSDRNIALIIAFAVAGIAIVLFLFIMKLTVAVGTINGLIFYANLVQVNSSIFYPPGTTNILTVFIAWINLDLGIETCFYHGMDAYVKTWLQFVFPIYVWVLVGLIILISRYSQKMTNLLGSNPIAVLVTLFLLSYAKILRTIIAALSYTNLRFPYKVNVAVWTIDGNIQYLTGKHIPLFLIALLALLVLFLPYTLFLFLAQWIQILQGKLEWRIFSWLSKPSVRALLDAYHAPYVNKHRYWTGLLLLIRCILFLIFATAGDSSANLLAITSVITGLISFVLLTGGIYKSWYLGALETSLLLNLVILTAATYHVKVSGGNQAAVVFFFLSIVFITFAGIIIFHIFLQSKALAKRWKQSHPDDRENVPPVTSSKSSVPKTSKESFTTTSVAIDLREPLIDEL